MKTYLTPIEKSITFANFLDGDRHFPDIPIAKLPPSRSKARRFAKAYMALPMPLYKVSVADEAKELIAQYANEVVDPRKIFTGTYDWKVRFEDIVRSCDAVFVLTADDRTVPAGCHAECAFAHALGMPVYAIVWYVDYVLDIPSGGLFRTKNPWYMQWAARYLSPGHLQALRDKSKAARGKREAA